MKFVVKKRRLAEDDAVAAAAWYDEQLPGLGGDFLDEVEAAVSSLADNALIHSIRFTDVRCVRLQRFKDYGAYYLIRGNEVWVLAVLHGAREVQKLIQGRKTPG
ncbi:MAG: type II toxin-antitoxin system RelE/ParE family toxin [Verrucomicrobiota bacterium]